MGGGVFNSNHLWTVGGMGPPTVTVLYASPSSMIICFHVYGAKELVLSAAETHLQGQEVSFQLQVGFEPGPFTWGLAHGGHAMPSHTGAPTVPDVSVADVTDALCFTHRQLMRHTL